MCSALVLAHGSRTRKMHVLCACLGSWIKNEVNACVVRLFGLMDQEQGKRMCCALVLGHGSRTRKMHV